MSNKPYSDQKKTEVVTTWLALGKVPMVEQVTGVSRHTIRQWKLQPWWQELVNEIQNEEDQELDSKLSKVVNSSLDAVMERIEGGEFHIDSRTGQVKRIPVKLRDVHRVMADVIDKRNLLRGKPTSRVEKTQTVDTLTKLADQFAQWVRVHMKPIRTIEGEVVDAVYGERPQGLQEGVQQIPLEAGTNQAQGREEQSPQDDGEEGGAPHLRGRGPQESSV